MPNLLQIEPAKARGKLREEMWKDSNYIAEFKFDGARYLMHIGDGTRFTSRRKSVKDGRYVEKTENFPQLMVDSRKAQRIKGTILDGEITLEDIYCNSYNVVSVSGSSPQVALMKQKESGFLHYQVFDILYYRGMRVTHLPLYKRISLMSQIVDYIESKYIHLVTQETEDKWDYYRKILKLGGEGVVLKNLEGFYGDRKMWVKVKKQNTWDVIITGFLPPSLTSLKKGDQEESITRYHEKGWIGSICIGQLSGGDMIDCGSVSGMDEVTRSRISRNPKIFTGQVIEIEAQERLPSGKFRHPRFVRFRPDKEARECRLGD